MAFSPDSKYLGSVSNDKTVKLWSFEFYVNAPPLENDN
jgi:WD40 repeat protein